MPSSTSVLSAYTSFAAFAMLLRPLVNEFKTIIRLLIPKQLQENFLSRVEGFFGSLSSSDQMTLVVDEYKGLSINEIYQASELYLTTRITPSTQQLKVFKTPREKKLSITVNKGEKIVDVFEGIHFTWEFVSTEKQKSYYDFERGSQATETAESRSILLSFPKKYKAEVLNTYLPHVVDMSKAIQEEKVLKLYSPGRFFTWEYIHLEHPATFDTLAIDPKQKRDLMDDLDRFVKRMDFHRRVGKAWKRGYLLYGPPGTGKSSLIAAMANYLKFDIYDLELTNIRSNSEHRRLLASISNRSILVIELQNQYLYGGSDDADSQLTPSGLLNFMDGLWSSCGEERIIVFTTNHKDIIKNPPYEDVSEEEDEDSEYDDEPEEHLDPALLRPGRIDMHIHMSYCTPCGFKILASNYLRVESHSRFAEIEELLKQVEVTPAEVAEELMKNDDVDIALAGLVTFLQRLNGLI